jgi:hypothetical protein
MPLARHHASGRWYTRCHHLGMAGWTAVLWGACSPAATVPRQSYQMPESAALCAVTLREGAKADAAYVIISPVSFSRRDVIRREVAACSQLHEVLVDTASSGGPSHVDAAARAMLLHMSVRVSARGSERNRYGVEVRVERCAGWPCQATYEASVEGSMADGFHVTSLKTGAIE